MFKSSKISGSSGTGSIRHYDKSNGRFNFGTRLIDEEEFKQGFNKMTKKIKFNNIFKAIAKYIAMTRNLPDNLKNFFVMKMKKKNSKNWQILALILIITKT